MSKGKMNKGPAALDGVADIPLEDIKIDFYIRESLCEDRVQHFVNLINSNQAIPPIRVSRDLKIIDGRHRYEAHIRAERSVISCITKNLTDRKLQIVAAFDANYSGSLPPTTSDIGRVVRMLMENGANREWVRDNMKIGYSAELMSRILDNAQSQIHKKKVLKATKLIMDENLSLSEAARLSKISLEDLKQAISGQNEKNEKAEEKKQKLSIDFVQLKRDQGNRNRSFSKVVNFRLIDLIIEAHVENLVSTDDVVEIFNRQLKAMAHMERTILVKKDRFETEHGLKKE